MKNKLTLAVVALFAMTSASTTYGMGYIRQWQTNKVYQPPVVTNIPPVPVPEPVPPVVTNIPAPASSPSHPFAGKRIKTERIAKDILDWKETATISKAKWKGSTLTTSGTFPRWPANSKGFQGNFGLAVEQPDGSIVIGTWDWDRSPHQTVKSAGHNLDGNGEHAFFNQRSGARVWWFITGLSRDHERNVKERSNFYEDRWP